MCSTCDYRSFEKVVVNGREKLQTQLGITGKMVLRCDVKGNHWELGLVDEPRDHFTIYACPTCQKKLF